MKTLQKLSWLCSKVIVRDTLHCGRGCFAITDIKKGEVVAVMGGHIITLGELLCLPVNLRDYSYQISDQLVLSATQWNEITDEECINHSCNPNVGFRGMLELIAMRDIHSGEEVTFDYAMCMTESYSDMDCLCGSSFCRGRFTGEDWKLPDLQKRYRGYFQPYIEEKILQ
jgi:uncharacterized protein